MTSQNALKIWPVQDAKARFSELLEACLTRGPQIVTRRGEETAVVISAEEWRRLAAAAKPTLKELLLADHPRGDLVIPPRGRAKRRAPPIFE